MKKRTVKKLQGPNGDAFNLSISDLMAGLLAIFILILSYFILNFSQATAQLTQNNVKRAAILTEIQNEMQKNGFDVKVDAEHGILRIPEGVLFDVGRAEIKHDGQMVIKKLSHVIVDILQSEAYGKSVETIFIEGHTDNIPIYNYMYPSNWELSSKRAINTWRYMQSCEEDIDKITNNLGQPIFSCSGYAETRPVSDNSTAQGRKENRRIDLRFSMSAPTKEDQEIVKFAKEYLRDEK